MNLFKPRSKEKKDNNDSLVLSQDVKQPVDKLTNESTTKVFKEKKHNYETNKIL